MGTLIQTVFETQAAELRMLGYMGYDVTTFGNHEFDYRSKGLANMLTSARTSGDAVPSIVVCNVDWDAMEAAGLTEGQQMLKDAFTAYGVQDYTVLQKGDVRIAVVGVFGKDALSCAPTCELKFKDPVQAVKATVAEIKANETVDMIVCVSHSVHGTIPKSLRTSCWPRVYLTLTSSSAATPTAASGNPSGTGTPMWSPAANTAKIWAACPWRKKPTAAGR